MSKAACWRLKRRSVSIGVFLDHVECMQYPSEGKPERGGEQADNTYRTVDNPLIGGAVDLKAGDIEKGQTGAKHTDAR